MKSESSTPLTYTTLPAENLFLVLKERVERTPDDQLIKFRNQDGKWDSYTATQFFELIQNIGKGLLAYGIQKNDKIAILSNTRWEWTALDFAALSIGAVIVPIYQTDSSNQVTELLQAAEVKLLFAEDEQQANKVVNRLSEIPSLQDVYIIDDKALDIFIELGKHVTDGAYMERVQSIQPDDLATIVYTSGSTGAPKGVEITHYNFCSIIYNGRDCMPAISYAKNGCYLCFLPLAHVFARYMQYFTIAGEMTLAITKDMKMLLNDLKEVRPTLLLGVPRVFEKIFNAASQKAGIGIAGRIFHRSVVTAREWSKAQQSGHIPFYLSLKRSLYKKLVYQQIVDVLGGRVSSIVSGGAPIDSELADFFNGIGLPLLEGYGMTESCAPAAVNPSFDYKIGSVGKPLGGVTFAVADDDELLIKGPNVCKGYHNNPELTAEVITDGWLHTGDLGRIDEDGYIYITGRKKDLLITAGGKNVSPAPLESSIMTCPIVDQCLVIGDRKPFISALITLDLEEVNKWLVMHNEDTVNSLAEAAQNPLLYDEVDKAVKRANSFVSRAESIRKFVILDSTFTEENGMLTPSLKTKRAVITEHFKSLINDSIYSTVSK